MSSRMLSYEEYRALSPEARETARLQNLYDAAVGAAAPKRRLATSKDVIRRLSSEGEATTAPPSEAIPVLEAEILSDEISLDETEDQPIADLSERVLRLRSLLQKRRGKTQASLSLSQKRVRVKMSDGTELELNLASRPGTVVGLQPLDREKLELISDELSIGPDKVRDVIAAYWASQNLTN